jgi:hypothetical protein
MIMHYPRLEGLSQSELVILASLLMIPIANRDNKIPYLLLNQAYKPAEIVYWLPCANDTIVKGTLSEMLQWLSTLPIEPVFTSNTVISVRSLMRKQNKELFNHD